MAVNNRGAGQRVQVLTIGVGSTYINTKITANSSSGVMAQTGKVSQELSGGDSLADRDEMDPESRGFFTVTVDNG